jgi:hypothetical protein
MLFLQLGASQLSIPDRMVLKGGKVYSQPFHSGPEAAAPFIM